MAKDLARRTIEVARAIQSDIEERAKLPPEVTPSVDEPVLPRSLFRSTRGYIEKIVTQVNRTYAATCYDACAVMVRRLLEVLIIEVYAKHQALELIRRADGTFVGLGDLIGRAIADYGGDMDPSTKRTLPTLKTFGDQSAHGRKYNAKRQYIDTVLLELRTAAEDLLYLSGLRV